jgi:hypothetical protein
MPIGVSAAPYAKFPHPGVRHGGEIVDFRIVQNVDQKTRRPQYLQQNSDGKWEKSFSAFGPDGKPNDPITQWEITVDTGVEDDNGDSELRIFVDPRKGRRGTTTAGKRGGDAVSDALKRAKAHRVGLEIGGKFFLTFEGKVDDGENKVNTWSAEYEPPEGGPGSGKPVDEMPWLVGGGRYDKAAELNKWESRQGPALAASVAAAQEKAAGAPEVDPDRAAATREAIERGQRAHASSPHLNKSATTVLDDEEPPF